MFDAVANFTMVSTKFAKTFGLEVLRFKGIVFLANRT